MVFARLHRVSAHLMVAVVFLHMVRVFLRVQGERHTKQNRPLNWIIGITPFLLTLLLSFTGYLLPWDQLAYWAITVGTNIASAAPVVGEQMRFSSSAAARSIKTRSSDSTSCIAFLLVLLLFSYHMWRVRKDGGLACVDQLSLEQKKENVQPTKSKTYSLLGITSGRTVHVETAIVDEDKHTVASSLNLTRRLLFVSLGTLAVSVVLTVLFRACWKQAESNYAESAKAPWYFPLVAGTGHPHHV